MADILEAILGAMFVDVGRDVLPMRRVILGILLKEQMQVLIDWARDSGDPEMCPSVNGMIGRDEGI